MSSLTDEDNKKKYNNVHSWVMGAIILYLLLLILDGLTH
jgi:hypothetical protein